MHNGMIHFLGFFFFFDTLILNFILNSLSLGFNEQLFAILKFP